MNNSEEQRKIILEGNVSALVGKMAIPSIVMMLVTLVYNTVDTYFISQIDKSAAAAVGAVFSIQAIIQAIGFGFGMGVSSLCSRKLGEADDNSANTYASSGVFGAIVVAAIIGLLGLGFMNPTLKAIGCTNTMMPHAKAYCRVILLFAPIACSTFVINNVLKAEGHVKFSMYANLTGALINVILDPILIFVAGLGTAGAAIATGLSQVVSFVILSSMFIRRRTVMTLNPRFISRSFSCYKQIVTTGLPTVFRQGLASLAQVLLCKQAVVYGDAAVAAITISNKCYMLVRNVVLGLGQGAQPVAGYNYGAGLYRRTKEAWDFAIKVGTFICLASTALLFIYAGDIMWWFCKDEEVLAYGEEALKIASMVVPVMAFSTFVNQEYQCLGFKKWATFLASCRQGICFIPVIYILPRLLGVVGVEAAQPVADFLTCLISIPFYFAMANRLKENRGENNG